MKGSEDQGQGAGVPRVGAPGAWVRRLADGMGVWGLLLVGLLRAAPMVVYDTGFEPPVFASGFTLDAQGEWLCFPTEEPLTSQIVTNEFEGSGQQALIGEWPPSGNSVDSVSVYRPLNYDPVANARPLVVFRVTMAVLMAVTPQRPERDSFRWSVYNRQQGGQRLFSLDFDHQTGEISWLDDRTNFTFTGYTFVSGGSYDLVLTMHFGDNRWSASLNGALLVNAAPLTTRNLTLDLGDIDAVWVKGAGNSRFGDNYMVFDDYRVIADVAAPLPCLVEVREFLTNGDLLLQLQGEPGRAYAIEATEDWVDWFSLGTNTPTSGGALFTDPGASGRPQQFYRGRAVWP